MQKVRLAAVARRAVYAIAIAGMLLGSAAAAKPDDTGGGQGGKPDRDAIACQRAIAEASATFFRRKATALQRCEQRKVVGRLDPTTDCASDPRTARLIARFGRSLDLAIASACGGDDLTCGTSDDPALADSGWGDVDACPNFESGSCTNAIADCGDIATCVECVGEAAADQAARLYYGALVTSEFGTGSEVNLCQVVIGRATTRFLRDKSSALADCRSLELGPGNPHCEQRAARLIEAAERRKVDAICAACGGADGACGGGDDVTPAEIGFVASCPDVTPPGGTSCAGAIGDLEDLVACVDCVTEFKVDCVDRLSVPTLESYPPECNAGGSTTTTPTSTSSTTTVPPTCGNGVLDSGEECDASSPSGALVCPAGEQCVACACQPVSTTTAPTTTSTTGAPASTTTTTSPGTCGNGVLDSGEECDASSPSGALVCPAGEQCVACTCQPISTTTAPASSTSTTSSTSSSTSSSTTSTTTPPGCGNGVVDANEECDASSPSGAILCNAGEECVACTCQPVSTTTAPTSTSTSSTVPTTSSTSTTTTTTPPGCGNGVLDSGEECDASSPSGAMVCPAGEECTPGCACQPPPTTSSSTSSSTVPTTTSSSTTTSTTSSTSTTTLLGSPSGAFLSPPDAWRAADR
jgi:hypothetical protein